MFSEGLALQASVYLRGGWVPSLTAALMFALPIHHHAGYAFKPMRFGGVILNPCLSEGLALQVSLYLRGGWALRLF